ncbi:MAG TPA: OmcA/MtrC family decaheme c-type cytochrome [Bryobacteraceae bacterium]|nr:OmcA/MtrC family decaheme c-type cytochrome [Bryobacteraceae bacterium]
MGFIAHWKLLAAVLGMSGIAALISESDVPQYTVNDKAYYLTPEQQAFIRPGIDLTITGADIAEDGTITARFKITDPRGLPLEMAGVNTPGPVSVRFVASHIPAGASDYTAYTTTVQTSPITGNSVTQPAADSGGTFQQTGAGEYAYTFRTKAQNVDRNATHSIGAWAHRDLTEFDVETIQDDDSFVFTWVPAGGPVTNVHDMIKNEACNQCHNPLQAHDERRGLNLCVLCHYPGVIDPDTGNSVAMNVMTHKIHMGDQLPSVQAGTPYQIIGFRQSVADFSKVAFPGEIRNCAVCHQPDSGLPRATAFATTPSRAACGSCHDNVNFATGENHRGIVVQNDETCSSCHPAAHFQEFDTSVLGAHTVPTSSEQLPGVVFGITSVTNSQPGQTPTVTFTIKDKQGNAITPAQMSRLALVMGGPTKDYGQFFSENAIGAQTNTGDQYTYTMKTALPADATGSWAVGIEGYKNAPINTGGDTPTTVRDAGRNVVFYFPVTDATAQPRRQVVALEKCNVCHVNLMAHGGNRNTIEMCVICHNPNETDQDLRPADQGPPEGIDFRLLIHRIHTGEELQRDFTIFGFGGNANNFNEVAFPGDRRDCNTCHVNNSQQLPLPDDRLAVTDPRGFINPVGAETAACLGCHSSQAAASHALTNTTRLGEACAACHGVNRDFSVDRVHAR